MPLRRLSENCCMLVVTVPCKLTEPDQAFLLRKLRLRINNTKKVEVIY